MVLPQLDDQSKCSVKVQESTVTTSVQRCLKPAMHVVWVACRQTWLQRSSEYHAPWIIILRGEITDESRTGWPTVIPQEVEEEVVRHVVEAPERGFGISRCQLLHKVKLMCKDLCLKTPSKEGCSGKDWWYDFIARHPDIALRPPAPLLTLRVWSMNQIVVGRYFVCLKEIIDGGGGITV